MTAVPAQRTKTKDSFQLELDREIEKRKSRGLSTGFTDDEKSDEIDEAYSDDFEDDFLSGDDSDDELLREFLNEPAPLKSARAKETDQAAQNKDETSPFSSNKNSVSLRKSPVFSLERQAAVDQTNTTADDEGSFLNFLKSGTKSSPKILKSHKAEDSDASEHSLSRPGSTKKKVTFNPASSQFSPRRDVTSPVLASENEITDKPNFVSDKNQPLSTTLQKDKDKKEKLSPRASFATKPNQSESFSPRFDNDNKQTIEPQSLLTKTFRPRDNTFLDTQSAIDDIFKVPKPIPRKPQSVEDEPIKPQPRARRRHGSNTSSMSDESQVRTTTKSPDLQQLPEEVKTESQIKSVADVDSSFISSTSKLSALPRVTEKKKIDQEKEKQRSNTPTEKQTPTKKLMHTDSDMSSSTEDLLAQLQAAADGSSPAKKQPADAPHDVSMPKASNESSAEKLVPATEAPEKSEYQQSMTQLPHDVTSDVSVDQGTCIVKPAEAQGEQLNLTNVKSKKLSSTRKSPRTPPASYKGLGSLDGLQQLQTFRPDDPLAKTTSNNVRSTVYLQWLADREKKLKERKKLKLMAEEKENEEKEKQLQEKKLEDLSARKAWMEQKKDVLKEQAQKKRKEERKLKREKERKEEEKRNSARKADTVREKALAEAKRKHREEMRKKREEERIEKQQKKEREDESEKKLNEWMEKRSKQWEADRKKEIREKKAKEKKIKQQKEVKSKQGEYSYAEWREKKEAQEKGRRRLNVHDEERPPWSPANKVIPRVR